VSAHRLASNKESAPVAGNDEDNELVERWRAAASDSEREEVFRQLFERFYRPLRCFFSKRGWPREECEDLVQETFLRVHRKLAEFRGDSQLATWVFQIAANIYRNALRDRSAQKRDGQEISLDPPGGSESLGLGDLLESEEPSVLDHLLDEEKREKLRQAIGCLPPQMRRCVELRVVAGLKYREIADVLRISIETVKAHLFQARQRLRTELGDYFTGLDFD
jgi:RNA polymerase sigma-70 factor (ECF subfamily)